MNSASKIVNSVLGRFDLHLGRASNSYGLKYELGRTQGRLDEALKTLEHEKILALSKSRWRADEPDACLTWGVTMVGDQFVRFLLEQVKLKETSTIVEIGPGYGRILKALLRENGSL